MDSAPCASVPAPADEEKLPVDVPLANGHREQHFSTSRLILIASAPCVMWLAGVMQICGMGFLLPVIQEKLHSSEGPVQWVNSSFNITWGCFALVAGRVGDIYGLRKCYVFGLSWYLVWIFISAFMPNIIGLSFARGLAGIGYAVGSPCGSAIVGTYLPRGRLRTNAYAIMAGSGAVGAGIGWILAGILSDLNRFGWRVLPVVVSAPLLYPIAIGIFVVPNDHPHPNDKKIDWIGAVSITAAQLSLMLGLTLSISQRERWRAPYIPALIASSILLFSLFVWQQLRLDRGPHLVAPLTPRRLFKGNCGQLVPIYISAIFVWQKNLTIMGAYFYNQVLHLTGMQSGLRVGPSAFAGFTAALVVAILLPRVPGRALLIAVDFVGAFSGICFAVRGVETPYWRADLWAWLLTGWASDGTTAVASTVISHCTEEGDQAVANALFITFSRFGSALGLAVVTILRESIQEASSLEGGLDTWKGIQASFYYTAACGFAALVIAVGMQGWHIVGQEVQ